MVAASTGTPFEYSRRRCGMPHLALVLKTSCSSVYSDRDRH